MHEADHKSSLAEVFSEDVCYRYSMSVLPVMNKCIFMLLNVFILLRPLDIHYRNNIAILIYISNIIRLSKVLKKAIIFKIY